MSCPLPPKHEGHPFNLFKVESKYVVALRIILSSFFFVVVAVVKINMVKTGWKYTKQAPNKSKSNMLKKSTASSKLNRVAPKVNDRNNRSADTIRRLKLYSNGKPIRNKEGTVVGGQFMMKDRAGDVKITSSTGRIAPDRRWFGNTRVVGATELDRFRAEMTEKVADPYSVVLKRKKLPMGLLQDAAELMHKKGAAGSNNGLLENEPFDHTFGSKSRRKRVKLDQYWKARTDTSLTDPSATNSTKPAEATNAANQIPSNVAQIVPKGPEDDAEAYAALLVAAKTSIDTYQTINAREGMVPWGKDSNVEVTSGEGVDWHHQVKDDMFNKGQSKRIWGEFFKVIDCSDVVLHVIDARNVPGTRCTMIERHIAKNASHKHLVFIINKIDLVPNWVAKRWVGELSKVRPTIAFHASLTHAFGKGALISLLRQFAKLHDDKKQISVGVVGYPNCGKSSVINTLISQKSCKVAPIPGETKIWQYVSLFKRVSLIDCPGVVVDTAGDTEVDSVLKGVVRVERLENPEEFIDAILEKVKREHIVAQYQLSPDDATFSNSKELLERISLRSGRLLKGGEPCLRSSAIQLIMDFQRGRLPHYVPPPELKESEESNNGIGNESATMIMDKDSEVQTSENQNDDDDDDAMTLSNTKN
jgi:nuclear GTP-binding protein